MQLVSSTRLGGSADDWVYHIEYDADEDRITLSGDTRSVDFPTTADAWDRTFGGDYDGFYLEIDLSGGGAEQLRYSTLIGGPGRDFVTAHKRFGSRVVLAGEAAAGFPTTPGAFQPLHGGGDADGFVATLDLAAAPAAQLLSSTYLGGSGEDGNRQDFVDQGIDLDIDELGRAVVAGRTTSADFPVTADALQPVFGGMQDGFVARFDLDNANLLYSSFAGGPGSDAFSQVHYDGAGVVTAAGYAGGAGFPVSGDALQAGFGGGNSDIAVLRADTSVAGAAGLVYGTYLGGDATAPATSTERCRGLEIEASGNIVLAGFVGSETFPTTYGAISRSLAGPPVNAVLARIDPRQAPARQLLYSSYLLGAGVHAALGLDIDGRGGLLVSGVTTASDFFTTPDAFDSSKSVGLDGFVAQIDLLPAGVQPIGEANAGCETTPYIGVTSAPRGPGAVFGVTCGLAPAGARGYLVLGAEARRPQPLAGIKIHVDLFGPLTAVEVTADPTGYAQVDLPASLLGVEPVAAQFLWFHAARCPGAAPVVATGALVF